MKNQICIAQQTKQRIFKAKKKNKKLIKDLIKITQKEDN